MTESEFMEALYAAMGNPEKLLELARCAPNSALKSKALAAATKAKPNRNTASRKKTPSPSI